MDTTNAINDFMEVMKNSGYSQNYRKDTVVAAKKGIEGKMRQAEEGVRSYYRLQTEGAKDRYKSKMSKKSNWFKRPETPVTREGPKPAIRKRKAQLEKKEKIPSDSRQVDVVVFVPHTKNSSLKNLLQLTDDRITKPLNAGKTRYIERAGSSMSSILVKKNPWYQLQGGCQRQTCYHCNNSSHGKGISCRQEGIVYELKCSICEEAGNKARYVGESSRSFYERLGEHFYLFKQRKEGDPEKNEASSALWLHSKAKHDGKMKIVHWKTKILSSHRTALNRQVTEATIISNEGVDSLLNSKNEFGAN